MVLASFYDRRFKVNVWISAIQKPFPGQSKRTRILVDKTKASIIKTSPQ